MLDILDLYTYLKVKETGDLLLLSEFAKTIKHTGSMQDLWKEIELQVVERIGVGDAGDVLLSLESEYLILKNEYILSGDESLRTDIGIKEREIFSVKSATGVAESPFDIVPVLEKYFGFEIDEKKTSVRKYLDRLNYLMKNGNKSD